MAPFSRLAARLARIADSDKQKGIKHGSITAREPKRLDPACPSLADLPTDIIMQITDMLQDVSPSSVIKFASVSSYFYQVARYAQHRHCCLDLGNPRTCGRLRYVSQNGTLSAVRVLEINGQTIEDCPALVKKIPNMTSLRMLRWNAPSIPDAIIESLQHLPWARLHLPLSANAERNTEVSAQVLENLTNNHNLESIDIHVTYIKGEKLRDITRPLKQVLISCPNLRKLCLDIAQPRTGCVAFEPSSTYGGLGFLEGERPPALEELNLIEYPWGHEPVTAQDRSSWAVACVGYPGKGTEMDYWAHSFDWSRLRRIHDRCGSLASKIACKLTSIKEVEFYSCGQSLAPFFEHLPSTLESIIIPKLSCVSVVPIKLHGATLRSLKIHKDEDWAGEWSSDTITNEDLASLRDGLLHLEYLAIDVNRDASNWPYTTLQILSGFRKLRQVKLWFELGIRSHHEPMLPLLTARCAMEMFDYVRQQSPQQPSGLTRLHVYSGAPPPRGHGLLTDDALWPFENSTSFVCQISERDDDAAQGHYTITCPDLDAQLNGKMERILRGEEERLLSNDEIISMKVALDGPLLIDEWRRLNNLAV